VFPVPFRLCVVAAALHSGPGGSQSQPEPLWAARASSLVRLGKRCGAVNASRVGVACLICKPARLPFRRLTAQPRSGPARAGSQLIRLALASSYGKLDAPIADRRHKHCTVYQCASLAPKPYGGPLAPRRCCRKARSAVLLGSGCRLPLVAVLRKSRGRGERIRRRQSIAASVASSHSRVAAARRAVLPSAHRHAECPHSAVWRR
jgi:hypothetical protein